MSLLKLNVGPFSYDGFEGHENIVVKWKENYNKEFSCITHAVEHNYISPSSTVGTQLHVSALYVGHLQVVI